MQGVKLRIAFGADIDARDDFGRTFHDEAVKGYPEDVQVLVPGRTLLEAHGASVKKHTPLAVPPLYTAIERNDCELLSSLIEAGASLRAPNYMSEPPLHYALIQMAKKARGGGGKRKWVDSKRKRPREEDDEEVDDEIPKNYDLDIDNIDPEDDEEIEEDDAFNSEDEEKYGVFFSKGSSSKAKVVKQSTSANLLDEDEQEEDGDEDDLDDEDEESGEMMDISEMLNDEPAPSSSKGKQPATKPSDRIIDQLLPGTLDDDEDDLDEGPQDFDDDDDEEDEDDQDEGDLAEYVESLDKKKERGLKRKALENEESLDPGSMLPARFYQEKKVKITDLLQDLGDEAGFTSLRKQVEELTSEPAKSKKSGLPVGEAEAAPLPHRLRERMEREAAYGLAKKEVSKWAYTVKKNREADQLVFPMNEPKTEILTSSALVGKFKSETSLEKEIEQVLKEQNLTEKKQQEWEDLEMKELSREELEARRAELAKMRSLLFYAEQKQKKIAKIKSKAYRKMLKKAKEKQDAAEDALADLDPELARERALKAEAERIKERMTLKHKNTGKWAKSMKGRADKGVGARQELMDQLNRHQELTKKIAGDDSDDEDEDEDYDEDEDIDDSGDPDAVAKSAIQRLDKMADDSVPDMPEKGVFAMKFMQRGMENQKKQLKERIESAKQDIIDGNFEDEEEEGEMYEGMEDLYSDDEKANTKAKKKETDQKAPAQTSGRMTFGRTDDDEASLSEDEKKGGAPFVHKPANHSVRVSGPISVNFQPKNVAAKIKPIFEEVDFEVEDNNDEGFVAKISSGKSSEKAQPNGKAVTNKAPQKAPRKEVEAKKVADDEEEEDDDVDERRDAGAAGDDEDEEEIDNPWLNPEASKSGRNYKKTDLRTKGEKKDRVVSAQRSKKQTNEEDVTLNMDFKSMEKSVPSFLKKQAGSKEEKPADKPSDKGKGSEPASKGKGKKKEAKGSKKQAVTLLPEVSDEDSEEDFGHDASAPVENKVHVDKLSAMDVMQMAFANDDVFAEFKEEKNAIIEKEIPKDQDLTLPGWGAWAGGGIAPKKNVVVRKAKAHEGIEASKRKDFKLKNVIINEKRNKKVTKFLAKEVPRGFNNRDQYEESIRMPVGREWNAATAHGKLIAPKVVTQMGKVIAPLTTALQPAEKKNKAR
ncbi:hypothetical protein HDU96_001175 [Phlyctochytrium bullatum]|nr:hypothetical protein HDU96_001175 [Phlyctochytrium bullatum]